MSILMINDHEVNGLLGYLIAVPVILASFGVVIITFIATAVFLLLPFAIIGSLIWLTVWLI